MTLEEYKRYKYDKIIEDLNILRDCVWINYYKMNKEDVEYNVLFNQLINDIGNRYTKIVVECTSIKQVNILSKLCNMDIEYLRDRIKTLIELKKIKK